MNQLSVEKRASILQLLVEGNSLRSTSRIADVSINTVTKLLISVGEACLKFHSETVVKLQCKRVECDEIWSFVYTKEKNTPSKSEGVGNVWTWVAIDPDTKLVISWFAGQRDMKSAKFFMNDVWCRIRSRCQISTDGLSLYTEAVADTFGGKVDFAQLVKIFSGKADNGDTEREGKYEGAEKRVFAGNPDLDTVSTTSVERQNLTMRMSIRRFGRRTNAFSKKLENHCYAIALHFVYSNFVKRHSSIRVAPAMAAGLTKKFMTLEDMVNLVSKPEPKKRGNYKKNSN
jgi:IS1 family transposase